METQDTQFLNLYIFVFSNIVVGKVSKKTNYKIRHCHFFKTIDVNTLNYNAAQSNINDNITVKKTGSDIFWVICNKYKKVCINLKVVFKALQDDQKLMRKVNKEINKQYVYEEQIKYSGCNFLKIIFRH